MNAVSDGEKMHYLVTGHTGFKGSWLIALLKSRGHSVSGISLEPEANSIFAESALHELLEFNLYININNRDEVNSAIAQIKPDVVVHLAAQALVRHSYQHPIETFETNVIGTLNILNAVEKSQNCKAALIITTDKVYANTNQIWGYKESDALGAADPYSTSKAMADLLIQCWSQHFTEIPIGIARAGNVIGGGDVSKERLLPDLIRSFEKNHVPELRYPNAVRPWQHVLDCLNGYLLAIDNLLLSKESRVWNFGPDKESFKKVHEVTHEVGILYGMPDSYNVSNTQNPHEAGLLALDSTKSFLELNWKDKLDFREAISWTIEWYKLIKSGYEVDRILFDQIQKFEQLQI